MGQQHHGEPDGMNPDPNLFPPQAKNPFVKALGLLAGAILLVLAFMFSIVAFMAFSSSVSPAKLLPPARRSAAMALTPQRVTFIPILLFPYRRKFHCG